MYRHILIPLFLVISLISCTAPAPEETVQDLNVTPEGVRITPDVVYGHKFGMALTFDMYQPENQNGAGVIWINSGGFRSMMINFYQQTEEGIRLVKTEDLEKIWRNLRSMSIEPLLTKGFTVFAVRHGSHPKFTMNEIIADLRKVVRFIRYHAEDYGIDAERLGVWGSSSGGLLALFLATTADVGNSDATEDFEKATGKVAAVAAYCPATDIKTFIDNVPDFRGLFSELGLEENQYGEYSPINFASSDDPPALFIHGEEDTTSSITQSESMYQELLKANVESKFVAIPGAGHGFEGEDADLALSEVVSWFEKYLVE